MSTKFWDDRNKFVLWKQNSNRFKNTDNQSDTCILMCCAKQIFLDLCNIYSHTALSLEITASERHRNLLDMRRKRLH